MERKTQEQFILQAQEIHGNKYDYSSVEYKNAITKVKILCSKHVEFKQTPDKHLQRHGCPECGGTKKRTTRDIIAEFVSIHGDKYDYSLVEYRNNRTKVKIICPKHGEFTQTPDNHLRSESGCLKCGADSTAKKLASNTSQFIEKAREIHGEIYDYSLVEYMNSYTKIKIICSKHGEFTQIPSNHLQRKGCEECGGTKKRTTQDIIAEFSSIHGDKYDYSLVEYKNYDTKVKIICSKHGEFTQRPNDHLQGMGCDTCGGTKKRTTQDVIAEFISIHGDKYDYSLVEYKNYRTKVKIICSKHGEFTQTPHAHLQAQGCDKCINKNETKTGEILTELLPNIRLERQLSWGKLFSIKSNKRVDYFFEKDGLKYIVEYNGIQHYQPVQFGKITSTQAEKQFKKQQFRDQQLRDLCKEHGINLIEIDGQEYQGSKIKDYLEKELLAKTSIPAIRLGTRC